MSAKIERDKELAIALLKGAGVVTDAHRFAPIGRSRFCTVVKESEYLQKWRKVAGAGTLLQKVALCRELFGGDESYGGELHTLLEGEFGGEEGMEELTLLARLVVGGRFSDRDE